MWIVSKNYQENTRGQRQLHVKWDEKRQIHEKEEGKVEAEIFYHLVHGCEQQGGDHS